MIIKKFILQIIILFFSLSSVSSNEVKCGSLDKLSQDYAKCIAKKTKSKGKEIKSSIDKSLTESGAKDKFKKFKKSKTLSEYLKSK